MMKTRKKLGLTVEDSGPKDPSVIAQINPLHEYFVHDIKYDFYGQRMATCSSDHMIKIWDLDKNGKWYRSNEWKAHNGSIWKLDWAHPEFGQIIASCSFDSTVKIWEEVSINSGKQRKWICQRSISEHKQENICDVKFAPNHFSLKIATCSLDGSVRIYGAQVTDVSRWERFTEFKSCKNGVTCLDWNKSITNQAMLVTGGMDGNLQIWKPGGKRDWTKMRDLKEGYGQPVVDVSWAPSMGRSYHLIASASKEGLIRIWKLRRDPKTREFKSNQMVVEQPHLKISIWTVEWNITGTVLATSGEDGRICLLRYFPRESKWKCVKRK